MIEIAKIVKPQGIKGEVKALALTNVLAVFDLVKNCVIGNETMQIEKLSIRQGFLYIKFKGINTRNDAELLRNKVIKIDKELLEKAKGDELLVDDLIGMALYDDQNNFVGQIMAVENYGATDILVLEKEGRTVDVPFLNEVFMQKGDKIVVNSEKFKEVAQW